MGNPDELLERTTIEFQESLNQDSIEGFFEYLTSFLGCDINYTLTIQGYTKRRGRGEQEILKERYPIKVGGTITRLREPNIASVEFNLILAGETFKGLRFSTIPGYDLGEIPEGWVELMEEVQKRASEYFSQRPR